MFRPSKDLRRARQRIQGFYAGAVWKRTHRACFGNQAIDHPARRIAFQTLLIAVDQAVERKLAIQVEVAAPLPNWVAPEGETANPAKSGGARTGSICMSIPRARTPSFMARTASAATTKKERLVHDQSEETPNVLEKTILDFHVKPRIASRP
jgi:hypothetical protein